MCYGHVTHEVVGFVKTMDSNIGSDSTGFEGQSNRRGTNQGVMREGNERVILTLLRHNPELPKAEIARRTGLSAQTVARLIKSLEAEGLILRGAPSKGRIGQPSVPLSLNPDGALFLGMKVGRRSAEMIVIDFMGKIIARKTQIYDYPDFDDILTFAQKSAADLRAQLPVNLQSKIAGLGIAMPFFLWSWAENIGVDAALMENWQHRDLQQELVEQLSLPVFLQNDASSACSAEMVFGERPLAANTLCFYLAFFIGGGLILRGALYTGSTGNAAGFGPLQVLDLDGVSRPLIELASLSNLEDMLIARGLSPHQMWASPDDWEIPQDILSRWTEQCAHALAQAVVSTQTILDLELVVIDGWMPRQLCDDLTKAVRDAIAKLDMTGINRPTVTTGTLGPDARPLGAASLPLSARFLLKE